MNLYLREKDKTKCCGCSMCAFSCPTNAIKMTQDEEGFAFPIVDTKLCINCDKCTVVCPMETQSKNDEEPMAYAAHSKDEYTLLHSSSGGIFTEIAKCVIADGGSVCGCTIDENHQVKHIVINNVNDIALLQGSKYVQSELSSCLSEIESVLQEGRNLLFVGTPCQVSAIKNRFCKYENLVTIDLLCHGVPSQKLFDFYIEHLEKKHRGEVIEFSFRDKEKFGWSLTQRYTVQRNTRNHTYYSERHTSEYFAGFVSNLTQRYSCYECPYTTYNRTSDITLADFWGASKAKPEAMNLRGTSLVLINSIKGKNTLKSISNNLFLISLLKEESQTQNIHLFSSSTKPKLRDGIYKRIFTLGIKRAGKEFLLPRNCYKYKIANCLGLNIMHRSLKKR